MKYFGTITHNQDLATKSYVDSAITGDGYNIVNTIANLPVDKRNIIATIDRSTTISFSNTLSVGKELFLYVKADIDGANIIIPGTINGYTVSFCGYCSPSSTTITSIPIYYTGSGDDTELGNSSEQGKATFSTRTTVTLHIFFDGSIYYIDRFFVYSPTV